MTALGKIMTFLCLILSLVQGALTVMLYIAATHWPAEYQKLTLNYQASQASAKQYQDELGKAKGEADARVNAKSAEVKKVQDDLLLTRAQLDATQKELLQRQKDLAQRDAVMTVAQKSSEKSQAERDTMAKALQDQTKQLNDTADLNNKLRAELTDTTILKNTLDDRNKALQKELETMGKALAQKGVPGGGSGPGKGTPNRPQQKMEGVVKQTDPDGSLVISLGSDAGLKRGHTLEVYRLNLKNPDQSVYLGSVQVTTVGEHEAVAMPVGRLAERPKIGDFVGSQIN